MFSPSLRLAVLSVTQYPDHAVAHVAIEHGMDGQLSRDLQIDRKPRTTLEMPFKTLDDVIELKPGARFKVYLEPC